ncbi:hypothetical protein [Porphyromonas levii]|uniref:hypothetical protein n=1 Tax=Porphyromonas levii TaxID=28114 RepID=UPI0003711A44|nr:hypothetical protein [Porphyromonas levii]MBR8737000.1 hypothetical protein [Porphyromonas levii]MBR8783832.1 hypothetical protein [Porphyromonas levii]
MNRETLTTSEMMNISGGVSREEYCKTLMKIVMENDLDDGAMEGARHGYEKFNCAEFL